jgi:hypothetical protein
MFVLILSNQNSLFLRNRFSRLGKSLPCQNELSQNTATFSPTNAMSGHPGAFRKFFLYRSPIANSARRKATSIPVSFERIRDIRKLTTGETRSNSSFFALCFPTDMGAIMPKIAGRRPSP